MHIGRHIVQELVYTFGEPVIERWEVSMTEPEMSEVESHLERGRAHDVSLLITDGDELAVIREARYPEGAYRIPSGGVHPEESFVDGARRTALEETGLTVSIEDYLLQVHVSFVRGGRAAKWITHVMLARAESSSLAPKDATEIPEARWVGWPELLEKVNPILERSGLGELDHRARLHRRLDEIVRSARERPPAVPSREDG